MIHRALPEATIKQMVEDARTCDALLAGGYYAFVGSAKELVGNLCCHTQALAVEVERYRQGLLRIAARAENWSGVDTRANVADLLGLRLKELENLLKREE